MGTATPDLSNATWRKASYSGGGGSNCVEVAAGFTGVAPVRDSKDPAGPALVFPADSFAAFVGELKAGRLQ
ncbi:DUF397 domain-containing protein [Kitasatospora sp. NBC_01302]|uniref:DUF397 domain-containing protein n=1 Tax=Kitasatospora sp. NBC_01302 TaxID=2903575 RepID=UPI002E127468|nr:DUF397 domain-containing protein [Kitasatospora sp. NBC_01302]